MSKQRASKLDPFAGELIEWFHRGLGLREAQARLAERGCSVSLSRLSTFWESCQHREMIEKALNRVSIGADASRQIERQFAKDAPPELGTLIKLLRVQVMQLALHGQSEPQLLKLATTLLKPVMENLKVEEHAKDRELEERRVKLLEARADLAQKAETVAASAATPEEKEQKLRAIFGMT